MYPKRIFFVRHGEAISNITKEFSHRVVDLSLTSKGEIQSQQVAERLVGENIGYLFTSPLKRAVETSEIINQQLNKPVEILEEFREINVGVLELQPPSIKTWKIHDVILQKWKEGEDEAFPKGETLTDLLTRVHHGFSRIKEIASDNKATEVVVIGHGGVLYQLIDHYFKSSVHEENDEFSIDNASISILTTEFDSYRMDHHLTDFNDTSHLTGVAAQLIRGTPEGEFDRLN